MSAARPYHHGNLRRAVLDQAAAVVHDRGASELSLREIAATIGVTHAAPRRYFPGRQDLLEALAVEGFARLGVRLREAIAASPDYTEQLRSVARSYVEFTTTEANLVEVMFAHKHGAEGHSVADSATAAFSPIVQVFRLGQAQSRLPHHDPERIAVVFLATLQGLAGLVNCGVVPAGHVDDVVADAVAQFPDGP
ncbi:TetR/AcrR family transcriptional regulator [Isoptericola sp. NPDC057391]|uniref:TetR/AcrR family transcriptional regulator n=1 Tax=Isoptericola sp. NPDC057391 TaxID=3346117 RepID=UPI00363C2563